MIEMAGKSWCDGTYLINRKNSKIWVIEYIISGKGTVKDIENPEKEYYPQADDIYLLSAGKNHFYFFPKFSLFFDIHYLFAVFFCHRKLNSTLLPFYN